MKFLQNMRILQDYSWFQIILQILEKTKNIFYRISSESTDYFEPKFFQHERRIFYSTLTRRRQI